jgi:hypothetical protein
VLGDILSQGFEISGLEGFELESTDIHPRIDLIFDEAARPGVAPSTVVDQWPADVWVDVTLRGRDS